MDYVSKRHGGKQKIHAENRIIPLNLHHTLLHVAIRKPTQYLLDNIHSIHITSDQPCYPACLNDDTKVQAIYIGDEDEYDGMYGFLIIINSSPLDFDVDISDNDTLYMLS